jgi:hypothetical protein
VSSLFLTTKLTPLITFVSYLFSLPPPHIQYKPGCHDIAEIDDKYKKEQGHTIHLFTQIHSNKHKINSNIHIMY